MLPKELEEFRKIIQGHAKDYGLDFFDTIFELVSYDEINKIAAYGGFPKRYPHWRFGMEYQQLSKSYEYGLSKIYEMVINNDPCYAYLMRGNSMMDQKLVMAHVFGHCDFFKNNLYFSGTDRKMMDTMANHATRVKRYIDRYGIDEVESFIDICLSIENLIDRNSDGREEPLYKVKKESPLILNSPNSYMDDYINPKDKIKKEEEKVYFNPQKDVISFLMRNAPLEDWQIDILDIIRKEMYYYYPQGATKTLNEGWASYWHSKIMTEKVLNDSEIIEFADKHAGVMHMAENGYNPYKIGIELFRDIEERWNKGQFGRDWDECDNSKDKANWDLKLGKGKEKIFEIRKRMNDISFIEEFLTEDFCIKNKMYVYKKNPKTNQFEVDSTNFKAIKNMLLFKMTNFGNPIIEVIHNNFEGKGTLLLRHLFEGVELQPDYLKATLTNIQKLWKRKVMIQTAVKGMVYTYSHDGESFSSELYKGEE